MSGNDLVATQNISFTQSRIPPEQYAGFRDFVNAYIRATRRQVRVVKVLGNVNLLIGHTCIVQLANREIVAVPGLWPFFCELCLKMPM